MRKPRVDIFVKTYGKDFKLMDYSMQSIKKNVTGYRNLVILVPDNEKELFPLENIPARTIIHYVPEYGNGYLLQQAYKLTAHFYSDADYIMFSDSDMIFDHPINLQDFVSDGKPEILYTAWDKVGDAICWKKPTEAFLGYPVEWEHMRRNNIIYHRDTLVSISNVFPDLSNYVMNSTTFSEFNFLGAWAHKHEPAKYNFINTDNWEYTPPKGLQLWSWATKEQHPQEYQRSLDTINSVLGLSLTEL